LQKDRIISSSEGNPPFNTQPRNPQDIIFIWHHNIQEPNNYVGRKNGPDNMSFYNHFSLLEPTVETELVAELVLPHENEDNLLVDLRSPNRKQGHSEEDLPIDDAPVGITADQQKLSGDPIASPTNVRKDADDVPLAVRIMYEPCMMEHMDISTENKELYFSVIDNEGIGDCFYDAILNSKIFQRERSSYRTNVQRLRTEIQNYAKENEALSKEIFELYYGSNKIVELAIWNLRYSCKSIKGREDTNWAVELLSKNKEYLKDIGRKRKIMSHTCRNVVKRNYDIDENYCNTLLNYFDQEEINKLALWQWIHDIGQIKVFGGDSEMILFAYLFDLHVIVFKNTKQGISINNTAVQLSWIKKSKNTA
jgi:hypothetical protein